MCIFCNVDKSKILAQTELAFAIRDGFPVTPLHTLIIPKAHFSNFLDIELSEMEDCLVLIREMSDRIYGEDASVKGFNVGINAGKTAGQTVMHCHIHLIPRRVGDVENPRGGVRNVIPGMGDY